MPEIVNLKAWSLEDLDTLEQNLNADKPINCNSEGVFYTEGCLMRLIRWLFGLNARRYAQITHIFIARMDLREKEPIQLHSEDQRNLDLRIIAVASALLLKTESYSNSRLDSCKSSLKQRIVAMEIRSEIDHPSDPLNAEALSDKSTIVGKVHNAAMCWKSSLLRCNRELALSQENTTQLMQVYRYPKVTKLIYEDERIRILFFKAILQVGFPAEPLLQYPHYYEVLTRAELAEPIGYYGGKSIRVMKREGIKTIELQIFSEHVVSATETEQKEAHSGTIWAPLHDETTAYPLTKKFPATIPQILSEFAAREFRWINLSMSDKGVINYNALQMGSYDPAKRCYHHVYMPDNNPHWYLSLPRKWIPEDEAKARYGEAADGTHWIHRIIATRKEKVLSSAGRHSYKEFCYPETSEGHAKGYWLITFGKFPKTLPGSWFDEPFYAATALDGSIMSPDPSIYDSSRQHGGEIQKLTPQQALEKLEKVRNDIQAGADGLMTYQYFVNNCAMWADDEHKFFLTELEQAEPGFPMNWIYWGILRMPHCVQNCAFSVLFCLFGGNRTRTVRLGHEEVSISINHPEYAPWRLSPKAANGESAQASTRNKFMIPELKPELWLTTPGA